jgi:5-methyltetrahydrofolate--homocysteine methyltransferase
VGERINSSRKPILEALRRRDSVFIQNETKRQVEAGAAFIDVNAATMHSQELDSLVWLVQTAQGAEGTPLSIDSTNSQALTEALRVHQGRPMLNSITGERKRYEALLPLILEHKPLVVALCIDDKGMPETVADRLRVVSALLNSLSKAGVPREDIYFDPLVKAVSTGANFGVEFLESVRAIRKEFSVKTIAGLSNISYGLPNRRLLVRAFAVMAVAAGLDAAMIDPLDQELTSLVKASLALLGRQGSIREYIQAVRSGRLAGT